jgi:hypothetical protein
MGTTTQAITQAVQHGELQAFGGTSSFWNSHQEN